LTYDLNGNLTSDGTNTYAWSARNQLAGITGPTTASFVYDGAGRRRQNTIAGTATSFLYDGLNPVQEQQGATLANLLTGLGIDEFFTRTDTAGASYFLVDALGSTLALGDGTGTVQTEYTYEPFGVTTTTGAATANSFDYTGRESDGTLKYYRARYHHPGRSRFISEDLLDVEAGNMNLYAYVGNSPIDTADPLGLFGIEDLPTIPQPVVNAVAGFGDAFLIPMLVRPLLGIDDVVDRCSAEYRGGMITGVVVGSIPFVARGAAALGGTWFGHIINHNRYLRFGPGRMPTAGYGLSGGPSVPRVSVGHEWIHRDLRSRLPYVPPIGLAGRKSC